MNITDIAFNTIVSIVLNSLKELEKSGYTCFRNLIKNIEIYIDISKISDSGNNLRNISLSLNKIKDLMSTMGDNFFILHRKLIDLIDGLVIYQIKSNNKIREYISIKMLEYYKSYLSIHVKSYFKFNELNNFINNLREVFFNKKDLLSLCKLVFDDKIIKVAATVINLKLENFNLISVVDGISALVDNIFPDRNKVKMISEIVQPSSESKDKFESKDTVSGNFLSDDDKIKRIDSYNSQTNDLSPVYIQHQNQELEKNDSGKLSRSNSLSPQLTIVKSTTYSKEERIKQIISRYSKRGKTSLDKSPPMNSNSDVNFSIQRIISKRNNIL